MIGDPSERKELIRVFADEADELVQNIDADLLRLEGFATSGESDSECINSLFRALHTIKGSSAMLELHDVSSLAHKLENVCDRLRGGGISLSRPIIELLFEGRDLLTALIRSGIEETPGPPFGIKETLEERLELALQRPVQLRPEDAAPALHVAQPATRRTRTIRVDITRLDVLLDIVGELVIAKNRIAQIAAALAQGDSQTVATSIAELQTASGRLARTTSELQEGVMRARLVRIAGVFERFPRFVRDLAKSQGKEIELIIEGADTDLDKTIVDEIGEPLMHLIRNCIDHGIESPKRRRESGKPQVGTLRLSAFHDGNSVVLQISDDGGGIDLNRVRERGKTMGLVAENADPNEHDLLEMLFVPGFSTARSVSELSGRGVGMDVVRRAIARLSGTLEVSTQAGKGTTFTIRLPLTLAILRAMLVRIAGAVYALPVDALIESLRVDAKEIERGPGGETIAHRDGRLHVIRGAEFFELDGRRPGDGKLSIVVIRAANRNVGLVVDEFLAEQEIVVKPLSNLIGSIPGIAGGTILGDGTIALIVDAIALVNAAHRGSGPLLVSGVMR